MAHAQYGVVDKDLDVVTELAPVVGIPEGCPKRRVSCRDPAENRSHRCLGSEIFGQYYFTGTGATSILTEISASESLFVQALDAMLPLLSGSFDRRRATAGLHAPGTRPSSVPRRAAGARAPCRIRARSASSPCQPTLLSHNMNHGDSCYESSWGASRPRSAVVIPPSARPTSGRGGSASVPAFATRNRLPPIERRKPSAI